MSKVGDRAGPGAGGWDGTPGGRALSHCLQDEVRGRRESQAKARKPSKTRDFRESPAEARKARKIRDFRAHEADA